MEYPKLEGSRVLVTGGAGFIGSHLVDELLRLGAEVRVLDDFSTGRRRNLSQTGTEVHLIEGDIRDIEVCRQSCAGLEIVFHQAALGSVPRSVEDPATSLAVNAQGTANLLSAAMESAVERFIYASSSSVYGDSDQLPKREGTEGVPLSPYACSKAICEELGAVFDRCYDLPTVGLRYFNIFGPRQDPAGPYAAVIPRFFRALSSGHSPLIHGDGLQTRDFTFVGDAVRANLLAAGAGPDANGRSFNIAAGGRTSILELARIIGELTGNSAEPEFGSARAGDVRHSHADLQEATSVLGYEPTTALRDGLKACSSYYKELFGPPSDSLDLKNG